MAGRPLDTREDLVMSLATGTRLGSYEVLGALGAGGMGEVYRARDAKLNRDVAIKVLPEPFALDRDRLARFEREAQVLAALNHPNIAHVYGVHDAPPALVMELVEGEDLSQVIARGAVPIEQALALAKQIADALEAAHEKGIIHRDLKPANIKVREDGTVKVLDFGLAKAFSPESTADAAEAMNSPTLTMRATQMGIVLGTAAYMAPEQARGKAVDRRADVWAFGVVLYEMLTGRRAFDGDDVTDVLASVLKDTPPLDRLPPETPAPVRRLLTRCLARDRSKRLDSMAVARLEIEEALIGAEDDARGGDGRRPGYGWRAPVVLAGAVVTSALLGGAAVWRLWEPAPLPVQRLSIAPPPGETFQLETNHQDVAITPDGSRIVYWHRNTSGDNAFFVRALDRFEVTPLRAGFNARGAFVSPDGTSIAFQAGSPTGTDALLLRMPLAGGPAMQICRLDGNLRGGSWGADGTIVFATHRSTGLFRVRAFGGEPVLLTTPDGSRGELDHEWPHLLPGGTHVLFAVRREGTAEIALLDLADSTWHVLASGGTMPRYLPTGHLVYAAAGTLYAAGFDPTRRARTSDPVPVLEGVVTKDSGAADYDVSRTGTLVYMPGVATAALGGLTWVDREGRRTPVEVEPRQYRLARVSPDGRKAAVLVVEGRVTTLWVVDLERGTLSRLTPPAYNAGTPVWSPDSRRIAFAMIPLSGGENAGVFQVAASGIGAPERVTEASGATRHVASGWTPDGRSLLFTAGELGQTDVMRVDLASGTVTPLMASPAAEMQAAVSPDGRWVAYVSAETGRPEVYVRPYPNVDDDRTTVTASGARAPFWTPGGRELIVFDASGDPFGIPMSVSGGRLSLGRPARIVEVETTNVGSLPGVAPDGSRFLAIGRPRDATGTSEYRVVLNWFGELKALVK